ncbi:hypothetical protein ACFO5K_04045 [Nocardia halotolerans]|uniref:Zinc-ribbon domain-containing protein n=1 Tax=Nocardia halotolerans TaxID=1755878 RepID=A0ABV8VEV0_9NOCA
MTATAKARKRAELRRARGLPNTVPIERVRDHIQYLVDLGLTHTMISQGAEVGRSTVGWILYRNNHFVCIDPAAKILQVTHLPVPSQPTVLTVGARRRTRALNALGWPTNELGHRLGQSSRSTLNKTLASTYTTYAMWSRVRDLYDELSGTPGPSPDSAKRAKAAGHPPPLAWEGIDIDHPLTEPDWVAVWGQCKHGHLYSPENTATRADGSRACRTCQREGNTRARANKRAHTTA